MTNKIGLTAINEQKNPQNDHNTFINDQNKTKKKQKEKQKEKQKQKQKEKQKEQEQEIEIEKEKEKEIEQEKEQEIEKNKTNLKTQQIQESKKPEQQEQETIDKDKRNKKCVQQKRKKNKKRKKIKNINNLLPIDLLFYLFRFFPQKSLVKLSLVCKFWKSIVTHASFYRVLTTRLYEIPEKQLYKLLYKSTQLQTLVVYGTKPKTYNFDKALYVLSKKSHYAIETIRLKKVSFYSDNAETLSRLATFGMLTSIELDNCGLFLGLNSLGDCQKLEFLSLCENNLSTLPHGISKLKNLKQLDLSRNNFSLLPKCLSGLMKLEKLTFNENKITHLTDCFHPKAPLTVLHLFGNRIKEFPQSKRFYSLVEIDLSFNNISDLHQFLNYTSLQVLNLFNNTIKSIPQKIFLLSKLRKLYLGYNLLTSIENLKYLPNLEMLWIDHNKLERLPRILPQNLSLLDITFNSLKKLPLEIINYPKLNRLYLFQNPWKDVNIAHLAEKRAPTNQIKDYLKLKKSQNY
ncbi:hypothetical protein M0812_17935 [Anaeramoeba flamelloides]|uniref:F-box domain-containing protein n=1 Tax=Anaeramoeba flamelloides TaxID=1746091 RepID=A0AAV7Z896_9EUKA|nr:hypothetical protein M0812_17935 [Anaeramoeba flamelloides]